MSSLTHDLARIQYVGYGPIGWSPFNEQAEEHYQVRKDLQVLREHWNGLITYGTTGTLASIPDIAAELGFERVLLGVYDIRDEKEICKAIELIRRHPHMIRAVCLGNEGLSFKTYEVSELIACIQRFRALFPGLWITTSEPIFALGVEELLAQLDFCLPIIHPWIHDIFKTDPTLAAMWTVQAAQRLQILAGKPVLIKETGFPGHGEQYPEELQVKFWKVLVRELGALTRDVYLAYFEAYDNRLKIHFSARQSWDCYWGLYDENRRPKQVMQVLGPFLKPQQRPLAVRESKRPGVAVVIAGKDRASYMRLAIESVLAQDEPVAQIVLVNDNSLDPAVDKLCRSYAGRTQFTYVHRTTPGSSGTARNAGLALVETPLVCFLDDDDFFAPQKVRSQTDRFCADPTLAFVATSAAIVDGQGDVCSRSGSPEFFSGAPIASMLAFCRIVHSSVMMRTDVVRRHGGYLEHFHGEDWELWCRLLRAGEKMDYLDERLTFYRRHEANISNYSYLRAAVDNVFSRHLDLSSRHLVAPLPYSPPSGELLKGVLFAVHGRYEDALACMAGVGLPVARVARFLCQRELGRYAEARAEISELAADANLTEELDIRLRVHQNKFIFRRCMVGSPALLFEQRLLAQDALASSTGALACFDLRRYFPSNPKNISIERNEVAFGEDLFYRRVSLTSC